MMDRRAADSDVAVDTSRPLSLFLVGLTVLTALLLTALNLWFGELNQDEGWYLYASGQILQGRYPFIDFASTQGPVMSFVYAALWGPLQGMGLAGGRLVTALLGWLSAGLAAMLAWRLRGGTRQQRSVAAFTAFTVIAVNIYQSYFTTVVKTYALGGGLLVGGFLALTAGAGSRVRQRLWSVVAGVLLALAAGTRISLVVVLPIIFLWLVYLRYRNGREVRPWFFAAGATVTIAAIFGPFFYRAPEAFWFGMVQYHAGREVGSLATVLAYKAAFLLRTARAYLVPVVLLLLVGLMRVGMRGTRDEAGRSPLLVPLTASIIIVSVVHFMAPFPYDDYQAILFPLFAVLVGVSVTRFLQHSRARLVLWLACALVAFSSTRLQDLFAAPRDRIWWPMRTESSLAQLRKVAAEVRDIYGTSGGTLLTQDTYLAVEAGLTVPEGMEMGAFSYFPELSTARAKACHVLNREMMTALLKTTDCPVAAISAYGFSIASPEVQPVSDSERARFMALIGQRYMPTATIPGFGQAQTNLQLYRKRD